VSIRRRRPLSEPVARAALCLRRCEGKIALLDRVRPLELAREQARLVAAFEAGRFATPELRYAPPVSLADVRRELELVSGSSADAGVEPLLLAERARELELEARLAEQVGQPSFTRLAAQRFPLPLDATEAGAVARRLLALPTARADALLHVSDDTRDPDSLWSEVTRVLTRENWPVRLEVVPGLVSLAAVADGVVRLRAGARLTARQARRIAVHEVQGHVRPRVFGKALGGVFVAGTAHASEDEEGRAIWLEEQAGLLDAERQRELAWRYLAAASVREGAGFWETVEALTSMGAGVATCVELACRVHRGGGLGRELIYLTGYLRAKSALSARPELGRVQRSGRVSLSAAARLLGDSVELDDDRDVI
jgi:hypothetical protein